MLTSHDNDDTSQLRC